MRNFTRFSTVLALAASVVACGDDETTPGDTTNTTSGTDATTATDSSTTDSSTTTTTTTATDTQNEVVANPCDPNPCTTPPAATCDGNSRVTYAATGTCTNEDGSAACEYAETTTACDQGQVCAAGACEAGGDPCDYTFGQRVSYVTEIRVGNQNKPQGSSTYVDECCFDLGGKDDNVDNALGVLMGAIGSFVPDFALNDTLKEQIESGSLTLLLETTGVTDPANQTGVGINGFYGEDVNADTADNLAGTGHFMVNASSFLEGTKTPLIKFDDATIASGTLTAGPSIFRLSIPILGAVIDLAVSQTQLEGLVAVGPNGQGLTMTGDENDPDTNQPFGAKLGGSVKLEELANALNSYLASSCSCVTDGNTATPGIFITSQTGTSVKLACEAGYSTSGCEEGECVIADNLSLVCSAGPALINPDIDLDEDNVKESLSVGVFLKATSATIDGVTGCQQ